ncbi:MAG: hypothetical protein ACXWVP_02620 [Burkholderiales bacterium]
MPKIALYSAIDDELTHYELDPADATLRRQATVKTPSFVQYAWPHPTRRYLYVTTSNRGPGLKADVNHVAAYRIDPATGALTSHGESNSSRIALFTCASTRQGATRSTRTTCRKAASRSIASKATGRWAR